MRGRAVARDDEGRLAAVEAGRAARRKREAGAALLDELLQLVALAVDVDLAAHARGDVDDVVGATGADYVVNVTPRMTGEVFVDGQSYPLQQFIQQRGSSFSLPPGGRARLDCGETTFLVTATARPRALPVPYFIWRWDEQVYTVGSVVALGAVPADDLLDPARSRSRCRSTRS